MQFLLVVLGELFLVLHLILIHFFELIALGLFVIDIADESVDALFGVVCAIPAFILVNDVLALHHIPKGVHFQLRVF